MLLAVDDLMGDESVQAWVALDQATVEKYAEALADGATFPAVVVFKDEERYWLADGFYLVAAARLVGRPMVECEVLRGSRRDAVLFAARANAAHGLRRTHADKRGAVT
jgi:hypothetical protein